MDERFLCPFQHHVTHFSGWSLSFRHCTGCYCSGSKVICHHLPYFMFPKDAAVKPEEFSLCCRSHWCGTGEGHNSNLLTDNPLQRYKAYPLQLPRGVGFRNSRIPLRIKLFSVSVGALFLIFSCEFSSCCRVRHKNSLFSQKFNFPLVHCKTVENAKSTPQAQCFT